MVAQRWKTVHVMSIGVLFKFFKFVRKMWNVFFTCGNEPILSWIPWQRWPSQNVIWRNIYNLSWERTLAPEVTDAFLNNPTFFCWTSPLLCKNLRIRGEEGNASRGDNDILNTRLQWKSILFTRMGGDLLYGSLGYVRRAETEFEQMGIHEKS